MSFDKLRTELGQRLHVYESRNVQRHIEQAVVKHGLEEEPDFKVAVLVQKGQEVDELDHQILLRVHLFGHFKLYRGVAESHEETNRHLLSEVLVLLHKQESHQHEDGVACQFAKGRHVAHAFSRQFRYLLRAYECL